MNCSSFSLVPSLKQGVSNGRQVAFFMGWISWLGTLRVFSVGIWAVYEPVQLKPLQGGDQFHTFYDALPVVNIVCGGKSEWDVPFFREGAEATPPTYLGLFSWVAMLPPLVLWIIGNWHKAPG
ncbi:hypothetical protein PILCRDRAFT_219362 [Piloderma croceum F 1598]|uniref:Uncharacterized protein n=1 Tax=Piloderma croceum (strain F 1598) TaxID=765440 RepID=A0A0C3GC15_PILCF|nr:hypothetical protein PILCRDRAFT_219362 [Piloderma croceum F 1598]